MRIILLFFPFLLFAQQKTTPENIEEKLKRAEQLIISGKTDQFITDNLSILKESKAIKYSQGCTKASLNLAYAYNRTNQYKKSIHYLKSMESEDDNVYADEFNQISANTLYSNNYFGIKMYDEAISKLKQNIKLSENVKIDSTRKYIKTLAMIDLATNYTEKKRYDSATYYGKKAIEEIKGEKIRNCCLGVNLKVALLNLAGVKFREKKVDSTEYYVGLGKALPVDLGNNEFIIFKLQGQINYARKNYDSAIINYKKGIELAKKAKNNKKLLELYSLIADAYDQVGKIDDEKEFRNKFTKLSDSITEAETANLKETVQLLVQEKQKPLQEKNRYLLYAIILGCLSLFLFVLFTVQRIKNKNKLLHSKDEENKELNQKLNSAFEEVVKLAKNNDSEFLTRFQEVYPDFFPKLLQIEPKLGESELRFCALLFLNFSSKEIAGYTFVQPQSIQTRKNRLRKKLNISSEEDIYIWMKNLSNSR
ncbi:tetratricopeptide repeat protein [Chryseobacterium kwangjuense]|uniref:HTH luxR-type domain-containing protein n=1 Tax=Chryseobacterium kwangjuense TaxID=267125 RepID=A0A135WLI7_9FLAO|nr:hypothetical protein [Chryseobacterium kwangjuense]KXH85751.1 hypothetical protein AU378_08410 [Chryseobacterium kwangjuense]